MRQRRPGKKAADRIECADIACGVGARGASDRGFVEHEQRIDERSAERGGEIDALHFAAGERARLAVECEVAQPDLREISEPRADLGEQQAGCFVQRRREMQLFDECAATLDGQQHEIVHREPRKLSEYSGAERDAMGREALFGR